MTATLDLDAIVAAADRVPGWMSTEELRYLAEQAATRRTILEIGSYEGRSTAAIARATPGVVFACDDWRGEADRPTTRSDLRARFMRHLRLELRRGKVIMCEMTSTQLRDQYRGKAVTYDMIFLDGDHSEEAVVDDITGWLPYLMPGGILAGHDAWLPGVSAALNNVLPNARIVAGSIWEWRAP